jgi:hypothetical protein
MLLGALGRVLLASEESRQRALPLLMDACETLRPQARARMPIFAPS